MEKKDLSERKREKERERRDRVPRG